MARWLEPRSTPLRLLTQVLLLLIGAGAVYLFVSWLGTDLISVGP
jgi:hypothetical protein